MKTTAQKLNLSNEDYEFMIFNTFYQWCMKYSANTSELQEMITNQKLFKWFQVEWKKQEIEFEYLSKPFETLTTSDYKNCFNRCIDKLFQVYPSALLQEIKGYPMPKVFVPVAAIKLKFNQIN